MAFVLYLSFVGQIWLVGNITTAMTHLEIVTTRKSCLIYTLDRFMSNNGISRELSLKVHRNAKHALVEEEQNTHESNVQLLQLISMPLLMELHFEIRFPFLGIHPFFRCYALVNPAGMRKICHAAISLLSLSKGDAIFHEAEKPDKPRVLFVMEGKLEYVCNLRRKVVSTTHWLSEAVLWTCDWVYFGSLRALGNVQLLVLDAQVLQELAITFLTSHMRRYAEFFVEDLNLNSKEELSDVGEYNANLGSIMTDVFLDEWPLVRSAFQRYDEEPERSVTARWSMQFGRGLTRKNTSAVWFPTLPTMWRRAVGRSSV